jgi:hypothetical protein
MAITQEFDVFTSTPDGLDGDIMVIMIADGWSMAGTRSSPTTAQASPASTASR